MNRNQRHRRMKAKRQKTRLLWGVNRFNMLRPRTGMACQLLVEQANQRWHDAMKALWVPFFAEMLNTPSPTARLMRR